MQSRITLLLAAVLFVVGVGCFSYFAGKYTGRKIAQAHWAAEKAAQEKQLADTVNAYRAKEQQLAQQVNVITEEKNRAVNDLEQRLAVLSDRVRQFAERPAVPDTPKVAADAKGRSCNCGPVIYRQDAEFLGEEAERAEKLRISLLACQQQYEAAEQSR